MLTFILAAIGTGIVLALWLYANYIYLERKWANFDSEEKRGWNSHEAREYKMYQEDKLFEVIAHSLYSLIWLGLCAVITTLAVIIVAVAWKVILFIVIAGSIVSFVAWLIRMPSRS